MTSDLLPIVSNLFVVPILMVLQNDWENKYIEFYYILCVFTSSFIYHLSRALNEETPFGVPFQTMKTIDHIIAEGAAIIVIGLYFFPAKPSIRYKLIFPLFIIIVLLRLATSLSIGFFVLIVVTLVVTPFVHHASYNRLETKALILAATIGAIITYAIDTNGDWYNITHSVWHFFAFSLLFLLIYHPIGNRHLDEQSKVAKSY